MQSLKSVFNPADRAELVRRIEALTAGSARQWGKMSVYQMAKHCTLWNEWVQGKHHPAYKQSFLGLIFGKMALRSSVKDNRPMQRNMPAGDLAVKAENGDVELQKKGWIETMEAYAHYSNPTFVHDFFGRMTQEQIGIFVYKHIDHHLRQFGH